MRLEQIVLILALMLPAATVAEAEQVSLGELAIEYDAAIWSAREWSPGAVVRFACIAPDCGDGQEVIARASGLDDAFAPYVDNDDPDTVGLGFDDDTGHPDIPFTVTVGWSGCRALDNPHHSAVGASARFSYWFGSSEGCNFAPAIADDRFLALVAGARLVEQAGEKP